MAQGNAEVQCNMYIVAIGDMVNCIAFSYNKEAQNVSH